MIENNEKYQKGLAQLKASAVNDIVNIIENKTEIRPSTSYSRLAGHYDDSIEHCKYEEIVSIIDKMKSLKSELKRKHVL